MLSKKKKDKACGSWPPKLISDGEGDKVSPDVVGRAFVKLQWYCSSSWCCTCVSGQLWRRYALGSLSSLILTPSVPLSYTHPLGSNFFSGVGRQDWYCNVIMVVVVESLASWAANVVASWWVRWNAAIPVAGLAGGGIGMGTCGAGTGIGLGEACPWQYSIGPHPQGHCLVSDS